MQPRSPWAGGTFLALSAPQDGSSLSLKQSLADLEIVAPASGNSDRRAPARFFVDNLFHKPGMVFLTITSDQTLTRAYANGVLVKSLRTFQLLGQLSGRLVLGDSPRQPDGWVGDLLGVALYRRCLNESQVRRHFETWTHAQRPDISAEDQNVALYLFDERAGKVIHNRAAPGPDLAIPANYTVVDKIALEPFWQEFSMTRSYLDAIVKNIVGFIPFGFCFYFCLTSHKFRRPGIASVFLGFLVSLTIEALQAYLPTRDSGTSDIFMNTLGAYAGILLSKKISPKAFA